MKKFLIVCICFFLVQASAYAQPHLGDMSPDITLPNTEGTITKLSSLRSKVVLLDFWASWCGPCRMSNRMMQSVYKKYNSKGFEIFGVSLDANKNLWSRAIQQDGIKWSQVIDTKAANGNEMTQTWNLYYIPNTFLIDKQGKIVAVNPEKKELQEWLDKLL